MYKTRVKEYSRKNSKQYLVTLTGQHKFKKDMLVYVIAAADFETELKKYTTRIEELETDYKRLRNKADHKAERVIQLLEEVNKLERIITDLSNRSFLDYMLGRLPSSIKLLKD